MNKFYTNFFIIIVFFSLAKYPRAQQIDSLKQALKNAKHDTTRAKLLVALSDQFYVYSPDSLISVCLNAVALADKNLVVATGNEKISYLISKANAINNIGAFYYSRGNVTKALEYYHQSVKLYEEVGDKLGLSSSLTNLGTIYYSQGDITKALEHFYKSLKIQEAIQHKQGVAMTLNNIGFVFKEQGESVKALEYYEKSFVIRKEINDKVGMAQSLNNLGDIYLNTGNHQKALECSEKSLKISEEIEDKTGMSNSLHNIGVIYDREGDYKNALLFYQKCLSIQEVIANKSASTYTLNNIASIMMKQGQLSEAYLYANRSMQRALTLGYPENIKKVANTLKGILQRQKKYKEAFEMYELEIKMGDSINNRETQKAAVKKQMQYAYEKREIEMKGEQDKKDIITKGELKQKEKERNYFIAGFGLVLILALFILKGYKQKQKANALIIQQKQLVEEKQKEILDSIHYAKRIQMALLPNEEYIEKKLNFLKKRTSGI